MIEKKNIETLIIQNKKSNLKNHWYDAYSYNKIKYSGEIRPNELHIWRSSHFLRGAYPIFHLTFDQNTRLKSIKLEKNLYHKFLDKFTYELVCVLIFALIISYDIKKVMFGLVLIGIIGI